MKEFKTIIDNSSEKRTHNLTQPNPKAEKLTR